MPALKHPADDSRGAAAAAPVDIIDIRGNETEIDLKNEVIKLLKPKEVSTPASPPPPSSSGLITYLDEYYLTNHEIDVLEAYAEEMAAQVPAGAMVVELGSGGIHLGILTEEVTSTERNLRKVCLLLQAFERSAKQVDYYALDLSRDELERTLAELPQFQHVTCHGLLGTYDDGREWLKDVGDRPKCILHLGSSIGNFHRDEAAQFLGDFANTMRPSDAMFIGVDSCIKPDKADRDIATLTTARLTAILKPIRLPLYTIVNTLYSRLPRFILNGLAHANAILNSQVFHLPDWKVIGEYVYDSDGGRHQAFVVPVRDVRVLDVDIPAYERIQIEQSLKYSPAGSDKMWKLAGLEEVACWRKVDDYGIHHLQRAKMPFPLTPSLYATHPLPTLHDWHSLWAAWDTVTRRMLPEQDLTEKPIKLRNACIFYLGHIPTFLDIQLTKRTGLPPTDPAAYHAIFERGIDPDVDNPAKCHDHSEVPDEWPPLDDILAYQDRVRARLTELYRGAGGGQDAISRHVGRAIWLGFEHELMHLETLLYMMLQSPKTLPPPHTVRPDFEKMAEEASAVRVQNEWFDVPAQTITVGLDDPEDGDDPTRHFGWDNEKPARKENVHAFQAKGRPITNEEYARYMYSTRTDQIPASWSILATNGADGTNGTHANTDDGDDDDLPASFLADKAVRTVYGPLPLRLALDWPVSASYDELAGCAAWMGGRIPTFEEARSIYAHVDARRRKMLLQAKLAAKVPAVNGHLVNDGVEETPPPPSTASSPKVDDSSQLFVDLSESNVGFRHWHPLPITHLGNTALTGQSQTGGLWEWTSTPLAPHAGFEPMPLYPGYTADFFDGKHNVVLGGSWATHPRIAGRRSFVNWYQRKYPYAWIGARIVRDVE
ncbi:hypothetical protein ACRE_068860 [Hapsidospora chrysogenum ATCC 11550]|uniref:Uncharacterized protein n=1 Tax=Hapsidospora chrysogenum (strain ATCC 11550 / CBS 779.69 / DSM 880 / IAM 14645 / JCM 23072 / IMI 49137) TaxID=857340 RepID=A0A086SZ57_HAPC1|nr:hypothetical protein ACRE_068860 [Hapsidospora chrysogenum ATCC 11550]